MGDYSQLATPPEIGELGIAPHVRINEFKLKKQSYD